MPEQIVLLMSDNALPRRRFFAAGCEFRFQPDAAERGLNPLVHALIAFFCAKQVPFVPGRKCDAVSPIRIMRHKPPTRRTPNQWPQQGHVLNLCELLEITK